MTDRTYTEAVAEFGEGMARLEGKLDKGMAEVKGAITNLTTAVEAGNAARIAEAAELRKDVDDHEMRLRKNAEDIADLKARPAITPKGMWAAVLGGGTLLIGAAGVIVNIIN